MSRSLIQSLEGRTLLSGGLWDGHDRAQLVTGKVWGIGTGDAGAAGVGPTYGVDHHVTIVITDDMVSAFKGGNGGKIDLLA